MTNSFPVQVSLSGTDATDTEYIFNSGGTKARCVKLYLVPSVSVSTHGTNYITLTVKKGATTIATTTTNSSGGAAMTAGTPTELTITGTGLTVELDASGTGSVFEVSVTKAGTGPAYNFAVVAVLQDIRQ